MPQLLVVEFASHQSAQGFVADLEAHVSGEVEISLLSPTERRYAGALVTRQRARRMGYRVVPTTSALTMGTSLSLLTWWLAGAPWLGAFVGLPLGALIGVVGAAAWYGRETDDPALLLPATLGEGGWLVGVETAQPEAFRHALALCETHGGRQRDPFEMPAPRSADSPAGGDPT